MAKNEWKLPIQPKRFFWKFHFIDCDPHSLPYHAAKIEKKILIADPDIYACTIWTIIGWTFPFDTKRDFLGNFIYMIFMVILSTITYAGKFEKILSSDLNTQARKNWAKITHLAQTKKFWKISFNWFYLIITHYHAVKFEKLCKFWL